MLRREQVFDLLQGHPAQITLSVGFQALCPPLTTRWMVSFLFSLHRS
jgi:hypothetical protein